MTEESRTLRLLAEVLDDMPSIAPDRLLASVRDQIEAMPRRHGWRSEGYARRFAVGLLLAAALAAIAIVQLSPRPAFVGPGANSSPTPTASSSRASQAPSPGPSAALGAPIALEDASQFHPGQVLTSRLFQPAVTFQGIPRNPGGRELDWCVTPYTSSTMIVLQHPKGCVEDVRVIRPHAVECGTPDVHPDADTLAAAILATPGAVGPLDLTKFPSGMFAGTYHMQAVQLGGRTFDPTVSDPDRCRLIPKPGSRDQMIELRGDISAIVVLIDVDGQLIVIRAAVGGHDATSGAEAVARGYASLSTSELYHLLSLIYDIDFG